MSYAPLTFQLISWISHRRRHVLCIFNLWIVWRSKKMYNFCFKLDFLSLKIINSVSDNHHCHDRLNGLMIKYVKSTESRCLWLHIYCNFDYKYKTKWILCCFLLYFAMFASTKNEFSFFQAIFVWIHSKWILNPARHNHK